LALLAAARVVGADLSLALELWEFELAFSPLADEEVSDLLFDRRERLSAGIFPKLLRAQLSKHRSFEKVGGTSDIEHETTMKSTRTSFDGPNCLGTGKGWG
jgi:hypothetical protein